MVFYFSFMFIPPYYSLLYGFRGSKKFDIKYFMERLLYGIERIESFNFQ